jgi:anti-sigma factor ChrR (cupin superfamily)
MTELDLPKLIRESLAEEGTPVPEDAEVWRSLESLSEALPAVGHRTEALEKLLRATEQLPQRYAPFYARMASLLDLDEASVEKLLTSAADPSIWRWGGLPGIRTLDVKGGPRVAKAKTFLVRFAPGARLPQHRHQATESVLILEGGYRDYDGNDHQAGDLHEMGPGSSHGFVVFPDEPCVALAVYEGELEFSSWPLRWLAKAMGR